MVKMENDWHKPINDLYMQPGVLCIMNQQQSKACKMTHEPLRYDKPIEIAEGVHWVGFADETSGLHCNPYLLLEGDEAVVIDGGSRPDFPTVMLKILQTGIEPKQIKALIYQHYDPDLCGSIPNFEDVIDRKDLVLISDKESNVFIRHYYVTSKVLSLESVQHAFTFSSGRRLEFYKTPYCHSVGSFVTLDIKTGVLFTSDLFGSISRKWELFLELAPQCRECDPGSISCSVEAAKCPLLGIVDFHRRLMTSNRALRHAMRVIADIPARMIAPQHGSILHHPQDMAAVTRALLNMEDVGIDGVLEAWEPCNVEAICDLYCQREG